MASLVSWPLDETIISLFIHEPLPFQVPSSRFHVLTCDLELGTWNFGTALIRESAHAYVQHQPEARERRDHRRPPVAHERKRQPFYGRQSGRHGDVVDHLQGESAVHADH